MTVVALIQSLRSKKQTASRSAFSRYVELVKVLASGGEIDADEAGLILEAAGRDEASFEKDVHLQEERFRRAAQLQANQQAVQDRLAAERELAAAQRKLQAEIDRLAPAIDLAAEKLSDANLRFQCTQGADAWLAAHTFDSELLEREAAVARQLAEVSSELNPLLQDRDHKRHSLENAEYTLAKLQARKEGDWVPAGIVQFFNQPKDVRELTERVNDLRSQIRQLDSAIQPRLAEQRRLQNELSQIHAEKLTP